MHFVRIGTIYEGHLSYDQAQEWLNAARIQPSHDILHVDPSTIRVVQPQTSISTCSKYADAGIQCSPSPTPQKVCRDSERLRSFEYNNSTITKPSQATSGNSSTGKIPAESTVSTVHLSDEQRRILERVKTGLNVFFTGPAGTGKSVLLREIIVSTRNIHSLTGVAITASTGIAGLNIGGSTIHSFAGIGLGKEPAEQLAEKIAGSRRLKQRWEETQLLIIDESFSMLDGTVFDKLEYIARFVRGNDKPFGGIQLVISGDFFQLPPVPDQSYDYRMPATFAFDALSWSTCISQPIFLTKVFRQSDNVFIDILSSIRQGVMSTEHIKLLKGLSRPVHYSDGIEPCQLFPLRREVENRNNQRLAELSDPAYTYPSTDSAGYDVHDKHIAIESACILLDRLIAPSSITLKIGAQVMLIQNIQQGSLVNGSVGRVIQFLTIHEALQRNIQIAELSDNGLNQKPRNDLQIFRDVTQNLQPEPQRHLQPITDHVFSHKQSWPLVHFTNEKELLCAPLAFSVQGFRGNVEAHRIQVPLILAWALSIHKSQGQTLTRVKVDLGHVFEKGQAYVALSRATTLEGLEIENFQPSKVTAHPRVLAWQRFWMSYSNNDDDMDSEEAIRSFWET